MYVKNNVNYGDSFDCSWYVMDMSVFVGAVVQGGSKWHMSLDGIFGIQMANEPGRNIWGLNGK